MQLNEETKKYDHIARSALCVAIILLIASALSSCKAKVVAKSNRRAKAEILYKQDSTRYVQWRGQKIAIDSLKVVIVETQWIEGDSIKKRIETNQTSSKIEHSQGDTVDSTNIHSQENISVDEEKEVITTPPPQPKKKRSLWWLWILIGISAYPAYKAYKLIRRVSI